MFSNEITKILPGYINETIIRVGSIRVQVTEPRHPSRTWYHLSSYFVISLKVTDNTYVRAGQSLGKFDERGPYPRSFEKKQKHSYDMYNTRYTPYTTGCRYVFRHKSNNDTWTPLRRAFSVPSQAD